MGRILIVVDRHILSPKPVESISVPVHLGATRKHPKRRTTGQVCRVESETDRGRGASVTTVGTAEEGVGRASFLSMSFSFPPRPAVSHEVGPEWVAVAASLA